MIFFLALTAVSFGLPPSPDRESVVAGEDTRSGNVETPVHYKTSNRRRHFQHKPLKHAKDLSGIDDDDDKDADEVLTAGLLSLKKDATDGISDRKFVDEGAILFERVEEMKEHQETKEKETFFCWKVFWLWVKGLAIILGAGVCAAIGNFMLSHMHTQTRVQPVYDDGEKITPVAAPPCTIRC